MHWSQNTMPATTVLAGAVDLAAAGANATKTIVTQLTRIGSRFLLIIIISIAG